jgi:hypothetical protein
MGSTSGGAPSGARRGGFAATAVIGLLATLASPALAGSHPAAAVKLPDRLKTPTGNYITLEAFDGPSGSSRTASARVEVCTSAHTPKDSGADPYFFTLRLTDGKTLAISPRAAKSPALVLTPLAPDQCVTGWISFALPGGATASQLVYTYVKPISWSLR